MKVRELIALLEDLDGDAEVLLMSQQQWPFENAIHGLTTREDLTDAEEEGAELPSGAAASDVFLVEGRQLRYGVKDAWDAAVRR